jgi:hypothetical protein
MDIFLGLQLVFDAVFLFGLLFLFHVSVHQSRKKMEESDVLQDAQAHDVKEGLQELLMTLKQLGKEVSDNIQERVQDAEEKTEALKKITAKLQRDLNRISKLSEDVEGEKRDLEDRMGALQAAKRTPVRKLPEAAGSGVAVDLPLPKREGKGGTETEPEAGPMGFSRDLVGKIYLLADEKLDLNEIARRTRLTRAEVQLILNLRGNRFTTPN